MADLVEQGLCEVCFLDYRGFGWSGHLSHLGSIWGWSIVTMVTVTHPRAPWDVCWTVVQFAKNKVNMARNS